MYMRKKRIYLCLFCDNYHHIEYKPKLILNIVTQLLEQYKNIFRVTFSSEKDATSLGP